MTSTKPIPQTKTYPLIGNLFEFNKSRLDSLIKWRQQYGDMVEFKLASQGVYLISDADITETALVKNKSFFQKMYNPAKPSGLALVLGQGLVTSQGSYWQKQRHLMQPVFSQKNTHALNKHFYSAANSMFSRWQSKPSTEIFFLADEMLKTSMEIITQSMFSTSFLNQIDEIAPALETGLKFAAKSVSNPFRPPLFIPTKNNLEYKKALSLLDKIVYDIIKERRLNRQTKYNDLLDMLLNAKDDQGNSMSDAQIRDEVVTIFTAGHETTANLLTWTIYLLLTQPDSLEKVQDEILSQVNSDNICDLNLNGFPFLRAVLNESLRLKPPIGLIMRKITQPVSIKDYHFEPGKLALFSIYNIHHHDKYWPEPEKFIPERFLQITPSKSTFLPFGIGERFCIGKNFAIQESMILLILMLYHFKFERVNQEPVEMDLTISIRPKQKIPLKVYPRHQPNEN